MPAKLCGIKPGKNCLNCPYPDCIMGSIPRVFPEETKMTACAELPPSKASKKRPMQKTPAAGKKKEVR